MEMPRDAGSIPAASIRHRRIESRGESSSTVEQLNAKSHANGWSFHCKRLLSTRLALLLYCSTALLFFLSPRLVRL